jgi:hypothetical protein
MRTSELERCLQRELRQALRDALDEALSLPPSREVHHYRRCELAAAVERCHTAIDAARIYASEHHEQRSIAPLSSEAVSIAALAEELCRYLEEEVNFVYEDAMTYAH